MIELRRSQMPQDITHCLSEAVAARARRRITRRLMPFVCLLYVIAFLDRVNISFAGLEMTRELGFSNAVFGFGAGVFFLGYFLFQIPGGVLSEVWSARKWLMSTAAKVRQSRVILPFPCPRWPRCLRHRRRR